MSTTDQPSAGAEPKQDPTDEPDRSSGGVTGEDIPREEVSDDLPLPNDPEDATGLLSPEDLNGEAPD